MRKLFFLLFISVLCINCSDDDDNSNDTPAEVSITYTLSAVGDSGVSGTAKFVKVDDATTRVDVSLTGTPAGGDHPMHIHQNNVATGGDVLIPLTNVNGDNGTSTTTITKLGENPITYEELIALDAHINVHLSVEEIATLVSQGNIGSNVN